MSELAYSEFNDMYTNGEDLMDQVGERISHCIELFLFFFSLCGLRLEWH
jgi:hypothetical protein